MGFLIRRDVIRTISRYSFSDIRFFGTSWRGPIDFKGALCNVTTLYAAGCYRERSWERAYNVSSNGVECKAALKSTRLVRLSYLKNARVVYETHDVCLCNAVADLRNFNFHARFCRRTWRYTLQMSVLTDATERGLMMQQGRRILFLVSILAKGKRISYVKIRGGKIDSTFRSYLESELPKLIRNSI